MTKRSTIPFSQLLIAVLFATAAPSQPRTVPAAYPSNIPVNYVRTWDAIKPTTDASTLNVGSAVHEARMTTQYVDGLGRPLQTVIRGGSLVTNTAAGADMVNAVEYDAFGREQFQYLAFAANNTGGNNSISDGKFKLNPFQQQATFASSQYPGESYYYGQTVFELSPSSRPIKTLSAGDSWVGGNRGVTMDYLINTAADEVRVWTVTDVVNSFGTYGSSATYGAGTLYKNVTADEHQRKVVEYKDKQGQTILKKVQISDYPAENHLGWLCTYYIYDDLGRLRAVLQPKAVEKLNTDNIWSSLNANTDILNELTFRYEYDQRGRMTIKKVPGAGAVYMVYDVRDRLVMTQDANLRNSNQWLVTLYDNLNRSIQTGLWSNSTTFSDHLTAANNSTNFPYPESTYPSSEALSSGYNLLGETHYDDYTNAPISNALVNNYNGYFLTTYNTAPDYAQAIVASSQTKGMVTWTRTRVLGTSNFLNIVNIYDEKGRLIQVKATNISGSTDIATTQYDFSGKVLRTVFTNVVGSTHNNTTATLNYYDDLGRIKQIDKSINLSNWKRIVKHEYDALGQLKGKKIGTDPNNSNNPLETLTYDYNIRGWLTGVNKAELTGNGTSTTKFAFELGYDKQTNTAGRNYTGTQYNGNISGMIWESAGDGIRRKYDYSYDFANRLMKGDFEQHNDGGTWGKDQLNFDVKMGNGTAASSAYDANGNIKQMQQWGLKGLASTQIDNLVYNYQVNGTGTDLTNKLYRVTDGNNDAGTKLGDFKDGANGGDDYTYDANGNLTLDNNKTISSITYNHLNLPTIITIPSKGSIEYVYDAAGNKLKKVVHETDQLDKTTLYIGGFVYENDVLQFLLYEEGRIRFKSAAGSTVASFEYDYFIKDHLGNVRMVLTEEQKTDAYPAATMETASATTEEALYSKVPETRVDKPSGYPYDSYLDPHYKVAKTRGDGQRIGPGIVLKVMAGDKFNLRVNSWWKGNGVSPGSVASPLTDLISVLSGNLPSLSGGKASQGDLQGSSVFTNEAQSFLNTQNSYSTQRPKAFVSWVLFDEQFKYVSGSSGTEQVGNDNQLFVHTRSNLPVNKNGYLYVYVSNETTNLDVFFDNLQVTHIHGPIVEETHYYPFGLTMAGISSKAAGSIENKKKFTSQDLDDDLGWNTYQMKWRTMDPQIGRFLQIDPLAPQYAHNSTYAYAENDVTNSVDLEGLEKGPVRYMTNSQYTEQRRSYRQTNSYVPNPQSHRTSGTYIPNQQAGSAAKPANIYEPSELGTGQQHTGPTVTRGNTQGKLSVIMTEAIDDIKGKIDKVTVNKDNWLTKNGSETQTSMTISWKSKEAEAMFNQLQGQYDQQVQGIKDANKVGPPPGPTASKEEWQQYFTAVRDAAQSTSIQILLLGPSPTQQILNSTQSSNDFKKVKTEVTPLPEVRQAN